MTKISDIKKHCSAFMLGTSMHGMASIEESENIFFRLTWVIIVLAGTAAALYCNLLCLTLYTKKRLYFDTFYFCFFKVGYLYKMISLLI